MDLGATICTPRKPKCVICPLVDVCVARRLGIQETFPRRTQKAEKPTRYGMAFVLQRADGAILLRRREERGLLGGMMEVPSSDWGEGPQPDLEAAMGASPVAAVNPAPLPGLVRHGFTHFRLELVVAAARSSAAAPPGCVWCPPDAFGDYALPTVMKKIVRHALAHL